MVDSRRKGATGENQAKAIFIKHTGLNWQRTPLSGALDAKHGLKGDLYLPNCNQVYCVEIKSYKDDHLTSKLLTGKTPQIYTWWEQTQRESLQVDRIPLLAFKFNRSKWFVAGQGLYTEENMRCIYITDLDLDILLLEDWLKKTKPQFVK